MNTNQQDIDTKAVNRPPVHRDNQPKTPVQSKKKSKKLKQNPFDDLVIQDEQNNQRKQQQAEQIQNQWIKPKTNPLTIEVFDHSRINKFYSHKSLQKYIRYLFIKSCPNPLWLSIKRQSQIQRIVFIDIEVQNNLFHRYINQQSKSIAQVKQSTKQKSQTQNKQQKQEQKPKQGQNCNQEQKNSKKVFKFLSKYNKPEKKGVFKQSKFLQSASDVWDALLVYDYEAVKYQTPIANKDIQLPDKLSQQILQLYKTYTLSQDQRKYNLYPIYGLPTYDKYHHIEHIKQTPLKNKILIIDCQMVMSGVNFQLARVTIINFQAQIIYDQLFKPQCAITNYNTQFSGITEQMLKNVTKNIANLHTDLQQFISKDTILVGHSLQNDLHAMKLIHDNVIDTSVLFARKNGSKMKLKTLAYQILNRQIQNGSHCSQQDCKATLQLMRQKIQAAQGLTLQQNKVYHLLNQLQEANKKIVIIDSGLDFIKHKKQYLGIEFQEIQANKQNKQAYISKFSKYFDKNIRNPDLMCSRIRKINADQQWQQYYTRTDSILQSIYEKSINNTVFFLNFQVNNSYQIYPQELATALQRRRPFCLFVVSTK